MARKNLQSSAWVVSVAALLVASAGLWTFATKYKFALNLSESLKGKVFLVEKGVLPKPGEYAEFVFEGSGIYQPGTHFIKIAAATEGEFIETKRLPDGRMLFSIHGDPVGVAKLMSRTGEKLQPSNGGVVPPGSFYMAATHPDSFDSRYALFGAVTTRQIIGRAILLF